MGSSYTGPQSILNATLGEYRSKGFRLVEDDHVLTLYYKDGLVARFSATGAGIQDVRDACAHWLSTLSKWGEEVK